MVVPNHVARLQGHVASMAHVRGKSQGSFHFQDPDERSQKHGIEQKCQEQAELKCIVIVSQRSKVTYGEAQQYFRAIIQSS